VIAFYMAYRTPRSCLSGLTLGDSVTQKVASVTGKEGGSVTMECLYDTSLSNYYFNWYREQEEKQPQYVLQQHSGGSPYKADFAKKRFSVELQISTKFSSLIISLLELSDSAVYYCALQPHSDGNQSETLNDFPVQKPPWFNPITFVKRLSKYKVPCILHSSSSCERDATKPFTEYIVNGSDCGFQAKSTNRGDVLYTVMD
uniref:Ig-like domain-containing protein n=1 Tax=Callorhinchus milii TaxID=7868 RepID=A0A4W3GHV5_CALMI